MSSKPSQDAQNVDALPTVPAPALPVEGAAQQAPMTGQASVAVREAERREREARMNPDSQPAPAEPAPPRQPSSPPTDSAAAPSPGLPVRPPRPSRVPAPTIARAHAAVPTPVLDATNSSIASIVLQSLNGLRLPGMKFGLFVVPDDDNPRQESFDDVGAMLERLRELMGKDNFVMPFMGHYMPITQEPHHLRTPLGLVPIAVPPPPDTLGDLEHGWVSSRPLQGPQAPTEEEAAGRLDAPVEEEEGDDEDSPLFEQG